MATLEEFGVLLQLQDQSFRLVRNLRANAADYIVQANAGTNPVALGATMKGDADRFLERLATVTAVVSRNQTAVQNALAIIGVTLAQANTLKTTLINECNHVKAATLTTAAQCITEANHILATVPNYEGLF
jgi:hypothetical protein